MGEKGRPGPGFDEVPLRRMVFGVLGQPANTDRSSSEVLRVSPRKPLQPPVIDVNRECHRTEVWPGDRGEETGTPRFPVRRTIPVRPNLPQDKDQANVVDKRGLIEAPFWPATQCLFAIPLCEIKGILLTLPELYP